MIAGKLTVGSAQAERDGFSKRLKEALELAGYAEVGPSKVAVLYLARSQQVVSIHAVRKWLSGQALPRQHHVEGLAKWLACDAAWLRFGRKVHSKLPQGVSTTEDLSLLRDLAILPPIAKQEIQGLVAILLASESKRTK